MKRKPSQVTNAKMKHHGDLRPQDPSLLEKEEDAKESDTGRTGPELDTGEREEAG